MRKYFLNYDFNRDMAKAFMILIYKQCINRFLYVGGKEVQKVPEKPHIIGVPIIVKTIQSDFTFSVSKQALCHRVLPLRRHWRTSSAS